MDSIFDDIHIFIPPKPLKRSYYRCDTKFHLDHIIDMFEENTITVGIVLVSGNECIISKVNENNSYMDVQIINKVNIHLVNKHNKGGQSSVRFGRIADNIRSKYVRRHSKKVFECSRTRREPVHSKTVLPFLNGDAHKYVNIVSFKIVESYMIDNNTKSLVDKIIIAGPGEFKNDIISTAIFKQYFNNSLFDVITCEDINESNIKTIYNMKKDEIIGMSDKDIENKLSQLIETEYDILVFGKDECMNTINMNMLDTLYTNENYKNSNINTIIKSNANIIQIYGGWVGIKRF
jgi:peptide subunit release factor 1 (eRF1)